MKVSKKVKFLFVNCVCVRPYLKNFSTILQRIIKVSETKNP